jgi:hypothetical protein
MFARLRYPPLIVWSLIAAALLLRAFTPAGWMPVAAPDGIRIALCTGTGPEYITMDRDGSFHKESAPKPATSREPCSFALAASAQAFLPSNLALPLAPASLAPLIYSKRPAIAAALRRNPRPPARGPPTFA